MTKLQIQEAQNIQMSGTVMLGDYTNRTIDVKPGSYKAARLSDGEYFGLAMVHQDYLNQHYQGDINRLLLDDSNIQVQAQLGIDSASYGFISLDDQKARQRFGQVWESMTYEPGKKSITHQDDAYLSATNIGDGSFMLYTVADEQGQIVAVFEDDLGVIEDAVELHENINVEYDILDNNIIVTVTDDEHETFVNFYETEDKTLQSLRNTIEEIEESYGVNNYKQAMFEQGLSFADFSDLEDEEAVL